MQADARASRKRTAEQLQEQLGTLDTYLAEVEATDRKEDTHYGENADADTLPQRLRSAKRRRQMLAQALDKLQHDQAAQRSHGKTTIRKDVIPTDPDAVWVKKQGRIIPGYNAHAAVDDTCGMVVAVKPTACPEEREQLNPMVRQVQLTAGAPAQTALADNGYYTDEAIIHAEDGQAAHQLNRRASPQPPDPYHCDHFRYDAVADEFTCPQGRKLVVEKKHRRRGLPTTVYRGVDCAACPVRNQCSSDRCGHRTIEVHREYVIIRRAHDRLRSDEGQKLYKKRKEIVEPVFGQWQHNCGVRRLRLRGLNGCDIELHLLAIGHNAKKFWRRGVKFSRN